MNILVGLRPTIITDHIFREETGLEEDTMKANITSASGQTRKHECSKETRTAPRTLMNWTDGGGPGALS